MLDKNKNKSEFKFTSIYEGLNETIDWFKKIMKLVVNN